MPSARSSAPPRRDAPSSATDVLQALLVACVVLWVLDVPRRVFNVSFYTEQLLTVCLGLTLALAFVVGNAPARPARSTGAGAIASAALIAYIVFRFRNPATFRRC